MFKNNRGFTLIEMLIVLLIISVLIILIIPNLSGKSKEVHNMGCEALVKIVQTQTDAYHLDNGNYPTNLESLKSDGYITEEQLKCPDGKELGYSDGKVSKPGS